MNDISVAKKDSTKSDDGSSASNTNNSFSSQQATKLLSENAMISNASEQFQISRSAVTTPGSELELNLQSFALEQQRELNNQYRANSNSNNTNNVSINTRIPNVTNGSKFNSSLSSNFSSTIDTAGTNQLTNVMNSFSLSSQSPNNFSNPSSEMYYKNDAPLSNDYMSTSKASPLYVLKIQNLPTDLTPRESHVLFALMIDSTPRSIEILQDGSEKFIKATIPNLNVAIQTALTLDSKKNLFGPYFPFKSFIQLFDNQNMQQIPFNDPSFNVQTGEFASNSGNGGMLGFVDPFSRSSSQIDDSKLTSTNGGNIWFNNIKGGNIQTRDNLFLRSPLAEKQIDYRQPIDSDYSAYGNSRQNSNIKVDVFNPPATAPPAVSSQFLNNSINPMLNPGNSNRSASVSDVSISQLKNSSLLLNRESFDIDPRANAQPISLDNNINKLQNYIANNNHLRNLPLIFASIPGITEADLDALSKVPSPSNPADQNPPCNTLYVGNLPPESSEQDMRALFQSQHGFSRLSFRNKPNNNAHGPMCFVEFEQIIYAARALSNLYGAQIPSRTVTQLAQTSDGGVANINKLMGIRLSFSKNPLGVRNTQTTMAHLQQQVLNGNYTNNINSNNINSNTYHQNSISVKRSIASTSKPSSSISSFHSRDSQLKAYNHHSGNNNVAVQNKYQYR